MTFVIEKYFCKERSRPSDCALIYLKNNHFHVFFVQQSPIHSFIRLFEPLVIRALKEYTISSSAALQQQVLSLLAQLVRLRVNYSLLDADQVCGSGLLCHHFIVSYIATNWTFNIFILITDITIIIVANIITIIIIIIITSIAISILVDITYFAFAFC